MRILVINYEFPPLGGGGGVACYQIASELVKNGHQVDYVTTAFKGLPYFEVVEGINVYRVPVLRRKTLHTATLLSMVSFFPSSLLKGIKLCRKKKYDVINPHFVVPSGLAAILLSKMFKIPVLMTIHGGDIYDPSKRFSPHRIFILRWLIRQLLDSSHKIIAQSSNTKNNARNFYRSSKGIDIIPLGLVTPKFERLPREELGFDSDGRILISVGRLVKRKGLEYVIEAVSKLPFPNLKYVILGDGPEEERLKNLAQKLKVEEKVKFSGFVPEERKFQLLSVSDIYVLSSLHEGFGICLLEAMYCGIAIVATDCGGQTDFLREGENALFVPVGDAEALAEKLRVLIEDEELRSRIGRNNLEAVKAYYIEATAGKYEEAFKGLSLRSRQT